jgi:catechol 2,3-dioxygenase-like lactoylglutathione lyase family enzyme
MKIRRVVPDLHGEPAASRGFYEDVIGLELGMDLDWIVTFGLTSNETAQLTVMREDATAPVSPDVTIEVENVDAVHAKAVERGYEIVHPVTNEPWGVRRFFVRDPNGAVINAMTHRPG